MNEARASLEAGERRGIERERRDAIRDLCDVLGLVLTPDQERELDAQDLDGLDRLRAHLKKARAW